jgi:hypothetical protein
VAEPVADGYADRAVDGEIPRLKLPSEGYLVTSSAAGRSAAF